MRLELRPVSVVRTALASLPPHYTEAIGMAEDTDLTGLDIPVRIETYKVADLDRLLEHWTWERRLADLQNGDKERVLWIMQMIVEGADIWPYISSWADSMDALSERVMEHYMCCDTNYDLYTLELDVQIDKHGDGWHRIIAAIEQQRETLEVLFFEDRLSKE